MKILFVCKHNRFRSKVAEALFRKYNKDKNNEARSAGVFLDDKRKYIAENVILVLKEHNTRVVSKMPKQLDNKIIGWADKIIIVADNVSKEIFMGKKVQVWKIEDCHERDLECIRERVGKIEEKIKSLFKNN